MQQQNLQLSGTLMNYTQKLKLLPKIVDMHFLNFDEITTIKDYSRAIR